MMPAMHSNLHLIQRKLIRLYFILTTLANGGQGKAETLNKIPNIGKHGAS